MKENGEVTGFRVWDSWIGVLLQKHLKNTAKGGNWIRSLLSGVEAEVLCLKAPKDPEPAECDSFNPRLLYSALSTRSRMAGV